jgi:prepilin-type N-terminal cleavage/methylation domain-containing protein
VIPLPAQNTDSVRDEGFTLIELLVVMIIIGILASIAIPTFLNQRRNAIATSQIADLRSVADEVEGFYVSQDVYPDTFVQANDQVTISSSGGVGSQRVTVGNDITYRPNQPTGATAYCLIASNPRAAGDRIWISDAGGVQPPGATCPY